ncbi:MAG TPA: enoyl-CoA hydratase/isomerase family protein, partial [Vicinamibacteria bacterium]|nr:enoyl-CoA hydratase/isomerase family protein [Vicinamibacteria bacterium]
MAGVGIERRGRLAVLRLDKARGNAIDEPLAEELARAAAEVAADDGVRGVLLASGHPRLFCPGLDLVALAPYDRGSMERFMGAFAVAVWALYGLPKPVVAAVGGAAVAGGCILALTADHRVLRRGAPIGLNEVKVGVPLPWSVTRLLRATVHAPALSRVALLGRNFTDAEALDLGLADELAEAEGFETTCLARLEEYADKDPRALAATKAWLREGVLAEMMAHEAERVGVFLDGWFSEGTQERIRATVASLR